MFLVDLAINPITATIAAIAIGVGIDFATHFTVRFIEEFAVEHSGAKERRDIAFACVFENLGGSADVRFTGNDGGLSS